MGSTHVTLVWSTESLNSTFFFFVARNQVIQAELVTENA